MFASMTDFAKQRPLKGAIGFGLFWFVAEILFSMALGTLLGSLLFSLDARAGGAMILLNVIGKVLIPTAIGLLFVYHKWGAGNAVNILLYIITILIASSPLGILSVVMFVLLAMRPSGAQGATGQRPIAVVVLALLPIAVAAVVMRTGLTALRTIETDYDQKIRNIQRTADLNVIATYVMLGAIDNGDHIVKSLPDQDTEICRPQASSCEGMVDLPSILKKGDLPVDPLAKKERQGTGYAIRKEKDSKAVTIQGYRIVLSALLAEEGEAVIVTRD